MMEQIEFKLEIVTNRDERGGRKEKTALLKKVGRGVPVACADEYGNAYLKYLDGSIIYVN